MKTKTKTTNGNWINDIETIVNTDNFATYKGVHRVAVYSETSGTGKSNAVETIANGFFESSPLYEQQRADGLQPIVLTLFVAQEVDSIVGPMLLRDGSTVCVPQLAALAMLKGLPLIVHEFDQFGDSTETIFNAILDDLRIARVSLSDTQTIKARDGFCVFGTTNAKPETLPERLINRFDCYVHAANVSDKILDIVGAAWAEILQAQQRERNERAYFAPINPRRAIAAQKLVENGLDQSTALRLVFGPDQERLSAMEATLSVAGTSHNDKSKRAAE